MHGLDVVLHVQVPLTCYLGNDVCCTVGERLIWCVSICFSERTESA